MNALNERAKETFQVLVADDSEGDRLLLRTAMRRAARMQIVAEVANGEEVIAYLDHRCEGPSSPRLAPDLLLLDLKMPVQDGFSVLEWLRMRRIDDLTIVVLTNSMRPDDICRALDLGADFFQVKPHTHKDCVSMVLALEERLVNGLRTGPQSHAGAKFPRIHQTA